MLETKTGTPPDLATRIAKRAYELYEQGGHKDGAADQNWRMAATQILASTAKAAPAKESRIEHKSAVTDQP